MLEGFHILQEQVAAEHIVDGDVVVGVAFHQFAHDGVAVVVQAQRISGVEIGALVDVLLQEGFVIG